MWQQNRIQRKRNLQVFDKRETGKRKWVALVRPSRQTSWHTLLNSLLFINAVSRRVNYNLWHRRTPQRISHNLIKRTSRERRVACSSVSDAELWKNLFNGGNIQCDWIMAYLFSDNLSNLIFAYYTHNGLKCR